MTEIERNYREETYVTSIMAAILLAADRIGGHVEADRTLNTPLIGYVECADEIMRLARKGEPPREYLAGDDAEG